MFVCESLTALIVCSCPYREKFIRLQHENKMLRVQQEGSENDKISDLQTLLEEAHRTRSELDTENRCVGGASWLTFSLVLSWMFYFLVDVILLPVCV